MTGGLSFQYSLNKFNVHCVSSKEILNIAVWTHLSVADWASKCGYFGAILRLKLCF